MTCLLVLAVLTAVGFLMAIASLVFGGQSGLVVILPIAHPILYGLISAVAAGIVVLVARSRTRAAVILGAVGSTGLVALTALPSALGTSWDEPDREYRSPDGRHVLVVDSRMGFIDPFRGLRLEETGGVAARYWSFGCVNGDDDEITSVRWVSNDELAFTVRDGEKYVAVNSDGPGPVDAALRSC